MSVAHYFTFLRVLLTPLFPCVYLYHTSWGIPGILVPYILITMLAVCAFTDLFDGFIARRKNQVTSFGKIFDPMADSIMSMTIFFTFTQGIVQIPLLLVLVFLYREFLMSALRTVCAIKGLVLAARNSGKIKTFFQSVSSFFILTLMILYQADWVSLIHLQSGSFYAMLATAFCSVFSAFEYLYINRALIRQAVVAGN
ncbi:MAG: CDP-alcohol phosphatidyltransferase family protein [Chlamydiota bacterium]